jgi:hypothetical protein
LIPSIWPSLAWVIAEKQRRHAVPLNFFEDEATLSRPAILENSFPQ